ncbi:MAG: arylsulfotransferase family protein [Acidobacteriota bacterium]
MSPRVAPVVLFSGLVLAACDGSSSPANEDVLPEGRWHLAPREAADPLQDVSEQERAQLLSMPYLSGSVRAGDGDQGVIAWAPEYSWGSHNLYTSGHGPDVLLMRSDGTHVHRWRLPFERAFPDRPTSVETTFFRRAHLLPGGDLIAIYQGGGLVRLDAEADIVWKVAGGFFNDFFVEGDESIWALTKTARRISAVNPDEDVLEDELVHLSADGQLLETYSILDMLLRLPFENFPQGIGDVLHSNTVQVLDAQRHEPFEPGQVLLSMREISTLAVADLPSRSIVWAKSGPWKRQHEPVLTQRESLLLFDNQGGDDGRARLLEIDARTSETLSETPGFYSPEAGTVAELPNGNLLVTESESGRAVEITPAGEIAWEFRSPHRAGRNDELVATLFEVVRLEASQVGALDPGDVR